MTDAQPISTQVMCRTCYMPTPFRDLAHDAYGIPTDLCLHCAARGDGGDCEPAWVPLRGTEDLPDIDQYQEPK